MDTGKRFFFVFCRWGYGPTHLELPPGQGCSRRITLRTLPGAPLPSARERRQGGIDEANLDSNFAGGRCAHNGLYRIDAV